MFADLMTITMIPTAVMNEVGAVIEMVRGRRGRHGRRGPDTVRQKIDMNVD